MTTYKQILLDEYNVKITELALEDMPESCGVLIKIKEEIFFAVIHPKNKEDESTNKLCRMAFEDLEKKIVMPEKGGLLYFCKSEGTV